MDQLQHQLTTDIKYVADAYGVALLKLQSNGNYRILIPRTHPK